MALINHSRADISQNFLFLLINLGMILSPLSMLNQRYVFARLALPTVTLLFLVTFGCGRRAFPEERFLFSTKYRNMINPYKIGDTLFFDSKNGEVFRIVITGIDSIVSNTKDAPLAERPYKDIKVYCNYLDYSTVNATSATLVLINNYPDSLEQSCDFAFRNFRGYMDDKNDSLSLSTLDVPFNNCYIIRNHAMDLGQGQADIELLYVEQEKGIIAFRTYSGEVWTKR